MLVEQWSGHYTLNKIWLWFIDVETTPVTFDNFHGHE